MAKDVTNIVDDNQYKSMYLFEYVSAKLASGVSGQNGVHAAHRVAMEIGPGHEALPEEDRYY